MVKKLLILSLFLLTFQFVLAQQAQIKGVIADSLANVQLSNASVSLLQAKDSILIKFTRTKEDGSFNFGATKNGDYLLLVTFPDYADYIENFALNEAKPQKDFGSINLLLKERLLQEVIVKGEAVAMRVKGDTTEFNAGSFKVQPNAKVEDLLKQLPGIQIDQNGKITAQGVTVNRVLVDGEEFFGDDPTLVTKNIRSDMVDKVQLYDDKSENAKFTGIDDGVRNKTINLKLNEDKKKGYFGKLDAGVGNDGFYSTQGLFNAFNNKKKFSLYSTIGNTKRTGLDWQTSQKYGLMGNNIEIGDDGGIMIFFSGNDEFSGEQFRGEGIPEIVNTGVHFENKWKEDKHALNLDFKYGRLNNQGFRTNLSQNNLPNTLLINNSKRDFDNLLNQQKVNAGYEFKIDSTSNMKVSFDNTWKKNNNENTTSTSGFSENNHKLNDGRRTFNENITDDRQNATLFYGKKFKKPGRTLTFRFNQSHFNSESGGILISNNSFYDQNDDLDSTSVINQLKENRKIGDSYKTSLTFTEKLTGTLALSTNYDFATNSVISKLNSYNKDAAGEYTDLDTQFSNDLKYKVNTQQAGLSLSYKKDKTNLTLGSKVAFSNLDQRNLINTTTFNRDFTNFLPSANFEYKFSKQSGLRLGYNGSTKQPSIDQLQPVLNNNDPLNITLGNKDLDLAFGNRFNVSYNSYKVLTSRSIWMYGSYNFTSNDIVSNVTTDESGKSVLTYNNINGETPSNFYFGGSYGGKIGKTKIYWDAGLNGNGNSYYNISNGAVNNNKSYSISPSLQISNYQDKYSFAVRANPGYQVNKSSLQPQQNASGYVFNSNGQFSYKLPGKVTIQVDYDYNFQEKTTSFNTNFDKLIVNSSIYKTFLEKDNLKLSLSGNDLLNQNIGFSRTAYGNTISQSSFTNIQRYFLGSVVWDFSKFGTKK